MPAPLPLEITNHVPHWVYICWDATDEPLYVGCTSNLRARRYQHRYESNGLSRHWFHKVESVSLVGPFVGQNARLRARRREATLIASLSPRDNKLLRVVA